MPAGQARVHSPHPTQRPARWKARVMCQAKLPFSVAERDQWPPAGSYPRCSARSSTSGRPGGRHSTSRSARIPSPRMPSARRGQSAAISASTRFGGGLAGASGRPPRRSFHPRSAAVRTSQASHFGCAHAFAGHADHVNVLALELRFLFQHHQRRSSQPFTTIAGLPSALTSLRFKIDRQVAEAAIVPDQLVCVFRAPARTPARARRSRSPPSPCPRPAVCGRARASCGLGGQSVRCKRSGRGHREVFVRAVRTRDRCTARVAASFR